jgi:hypothetical protein
MRNRRVVPIRRENLTLDRAITRLATHCKKARLAHSLLKILLRNVNILYQRNRLEESVPVTYDGLEDPEVRYRPVARR